MEHLKIRNWRKWQSYRSDRGQPPWIKVHRCIMRDPEWVSLTDAERGQLVAMWLLAADHDGVIPASPTVIEKLCYMDTPPNISKFIELAFIDAKKTSKRRQHDETETETETDKIRVEETFKFKVKVPIPKDFHLTALMEGYAIRKRYVGNLNNFTEYFISKNKASGNKYKDWYSAWQSWLQKDIEWHPENQEEDLVTL
jgi:hypothetical protein